jgi:hypothetical protein
MSFLDALLGGFAFYRRSRGGRWEHILVTEVCYGTFWVRVEVPTPRTRHRIPIERIVGREDWRS